MSQDNAIDELKDECLLSLLAFTRVFFHMRTGKEFSISKPMGRESHYITICRALTKVLKGDCKRLILNLPPRYGKSELVIHFVAWALAHFPDSNFLYISYAMGLARKQTQTIRSILQLPNYRELFHVELSSTTAAKSDFETNKGGSVYAAGTGGTITGRGAGIQNCNRFGGAIIIDDMYKPDEVTSDVIRQGGIDWYYNTLQSRINSPETPIIYIGQRLHESELVQQFIDSGEWEQVIIPALDSCNNALNPAQHSVEELLKIKERSPYDFASQYQQQPVPAGGGIFKEEWFYLTDEEPEFLTTFITADTAETDKTYNDATVFSFWGLYKIKNDEAITEEVGLHWIDCREIRVEPAYLESEFQDFYTTCSMHKVKPSLVAIEKKSTGATLVSTLNTLRGLKVQGIERTKASGSKTARFLQMQPYVAQKLISLPRHGKHTDMCIKHMVKITANNSHAHDDICFVAGTKISTLFGDKKIEDVKVGDKVITPFGVCNVIFSGKTGISEVITKKGLTGTAAHPIYCDGIFKRLDTLCDAVKISKLSFRELIKWKYKRLLSLMELNTGLRGREGIILAHQKLMKEGGVRKDFMSRFMSFIQDLQFLKAISFTTKTTIILITTSVILSVYHSGNTLRTMLKLEAKGPILKKNLPIFQILEKWLQNGIAAWKVESGIGRMFSKITTKFLKSANALARTAASFLLPELMLNRATLTDVEPHYIEDRSEISQKIASPVVMNSPPKKGIRDQEIEKHVLEPVPISYERKVHLESVYNITVETDGVYYANGILVSNCDSAYDAVFIGLIEKYMQTALLGGSQKQDQASAQIMNAINRRDNLRRRAR